jgi:hypothetical protein
VVNLLQLKLGDAFNIFTPRVQPQEKICSSWVFHVDYCSESSSTYDMIISQERALLGKLGIIINFNDHTVIWYTHSIPKKDRDKCTLSSFVTLIEIYMITIESKTFGDDYSRATKILDAEYKPASLDDVIKTCENLHVKEQHQLKRSIQKYEQILSI